MQCVVLAALVWLLLRLQFNSNVWTQQRPWFVTSSQHACLSAKWPGVEVSLFSDNSDLLLVHAGLGVFFASMHWGFVH